MTTPEEETIQEQQPEEVAAENATQEETQQEETPRDFKTHWEQQLHNVDDAINAFGEAINDALPLVKQKGDREKLRDAANWMLIEYRKLKEICELMHDNPEYDTYDLKQAQSTFDLLMRLGIGRHFGELVCKVARKVLTSDSAGLLTMQVQVEQGEKCDELRMKGKIGYSVKTSGSFGGLTWKNLYMGEDGFFSPDADGQGKLPLTYTEEADADEQDEQDEATETETVVVGGDLWTPNQGLDEEGKEEEV